MHQRGRPAAPTLTMVFESSIFYLVELGRADPRLRVKNNTMRFSTRTQTALLLCAVASTIFPGPVQAHNGAVALAFPVEGIVVDGDLADWPDDLPRYSISLPEYGANPLDEVDFGADLRIGYSTTTDALYFAIEVRDESIMIDTSAARRWDSEDGSEIYLDPFHGEESTATQFTWRGVGGVSGNAVAPERGPGVRWRRGEGRRTYEWRLDLGDQIDWTSLPLGLTLSADIAVSDMDADGSFSWMAWGRKIAKVGAADRRGDVILVRRPETVGSIAGRMVWKGTDLGISGTGLHIEALDEPRLETRTHTASGGHFRLDLPAGKYRLRAELGSEEGVSQQLEVYADSTLDMTLAVQPTAGVRIVAGPGTAIKASPGVRQGMWHTFGIMDGIHGGNIHGIVQDRDGTLWFGTQDGLHRFDGQYFTRYTTHFTLDMGIVRFGGIL